MKVSLPPPPHEDAQPSTDSSSLSFAPSLLTYHHANESLLPDVSMTYQHQAATILGPCSHSTSTPVLGPYPEQVCQGQAFPEHHHRQVTLPARPASDASNRTVSNSPASHEYTGHGRDGGYISNASRRPIRGVGGGFGGFGGGGDGGTRSNRGVGNAWQEGNGQARSKRTQSKRCPASTG